jgi:hypothetical protein
MIVGDFEVLIVAAKQFAEAAEISSAARSKLANACDALVPFRTMEISAFANLLRQAEEYHRTGVLPVALSTRKQSARKPKANAEDMALQVERLTKQLHDLYAVVHEETVGYGAIDEICEVVGKLNASDIKKVAAAFGIKVSSKATKSQSLDSIKRKLTEQKGSAQRIQPIATF